MKSWFGLHKLASCTAHRSSSPHVGLIHSGMAAYVSGDGLIIHRIRYQKTYIDAKQVKSYPVTR